MFQRVLDAVLSRLLAPRDRHLLLESDSRLLRLRLVGRATLRYFWVYLLILGVLVLVTVTSGMDVYHRTEMPGFCNSCHEMGHNFETWQFSRHQSVRCVDCHARPGLSGFVAAKLGGLRQLKTHLTAESIEDIHVGSDQRLIVSENCRRCHAEDVRVSERRQRGVAHDEHLRAGVDCVDCHSRRFAHPSELPHEDTAPQGLGLPAWRGELWADPIECWACHDGQRRVGGELAFAASDEDNCAACHLDADLALSHGDEPIACSDCHEADETHFRRLGLESDVRDLCGDCHEDVAQATFRTAHESHAAGQCLQCHRVMSPPHLYLSGSESSIETCLVCHDAIARLLAASQDGETAAEEDMTGFGDVDVEDSDLHQVHAKELRRKGLWCLQCHGSHGGAGEIAILRFDPEAAPSEEDEEPLVFTVEETGGTCSGGCHEDENLQYARRGRGSR